MQAEEIVVRCRRAREAAERLKAVNPLSAVKIRWTLKNKDLVNAGRAVLRQPSKNKYPFTDKTVEKEHCRDVRCAHEKTRSGALRPVNL